MKHICAPFSLSVSLAIVSLTGCSAKSDFEKICNAEQLSGAANIADPAEKATHVARWLTDNIHSSEAKNTFSALGMVSADQKGAVLREAAKEVGYDGPCPMADNK